ncbi:hypothetical protein AVEN_169267-1 [Araneus ventricosus]|uniref:Uncharacterized protein n=1 Tax=Araneus ventricosus TaxID=182803 RepID=A0A4Y2F2Y1_ARAVE|nr:hypothetical protein AVEN_179255-1 [Araneus ventricosus]GBM34898.1 hypothetical protein AVEN_32784-1 [Araneus ventricosus]GBM37490.1 hypothetical protein AVEN_169267-1 [Araneus ventricosus]
MLKSYLGNHEYVDKKPSNKIVESRFPGGCNSGVGLSFLYSDEDGGVEPRSLMNLRSSSYLVYIMTTIIQFYPGRYYREGINLLLLQMLQYL